MSIILLTELQLPKGRLGTLPVSMPRVSRLAEAGHISHHEYYVVCRYHFSERMSVS